MKTAILITARLKSTRLPKKAIKPIVGKPMIRHQIDRLRLAERPDQIIMCTSPVSQDDPLEKIAEDENIGCYRGEPEDVLLRLKNAAQKFGTDTVISCTADNPLTDPIYIDRLTEFHCEGDYDFSKIEGLPLGTFSYAVSRSAMEEACKIKAKRDTEVWGGYFTELDRFQVGTLQVEDEEVRLPDLRLTVDTPEDFELITEIFDNLYEGNSVFSLKDVVHLFARKPSLREINKNVHQKEAPPISIHEQKQEG
ncbi:cytidylyltransferase domain-containing protein [Salinibacter ruber]|uniref:cytidylyltransferase domain-containing protein n=1 Tax=Salinibacter ruber TaxID=146919 RepID=UPI00216974CB|nr:NTP transferase domain-containing protein [Salinibacter ruber]MCS4174459.1 spore coat polysaccharide biosynthesis protein SpsF [Salinibacter ruber]